MAGICFSFTRFSQVASPKTNILVLNIGWRGLYGRDLLGLARFSQVATVLIFEIFN